jgi:hypothetical protein
MGRLPALSISALRYGACGLALAVAGLFLVRAFHSRDRAFSNGSKRTAVAATHATTNRQNVEPKTFAWVPVPGADSYDVEFEHHGRVIYSSRTGQPRLRLDARWTYHARRYAFDPGVYHWSVWPIFPTAKGSHRGRVSVSSTLTIPG